MQIYGTQVIHGPQAVNAPHARAASNAPASRSQFAAADELQISDAARFAEMAAALPDIRLDRVQALRQAIASGSYESTDKLEGAVANLLDELA